jgi:hypothetical protein
MCLRTKARKAGMWSRKCCSTGMADMSAANQHLLA